MSLINEDINKTVKSFEKSYFNNSSFNYKIISPNTNSISTSMSNFLDNITKKK